MNPALPQMSLAVVGVRHLNEDKSKSNRQFEIALCAPGDPVELRPEPKNKHDEHAIAVFSERGIQLGYLTAERAPRIGALIRQGRGVTTVFQGPARHGAWIRAAFDGEMPIVPAASAPAPAAEPEAQPEPDWYPDETWEDLA